MQRKYLFVVNNADYFVSHRLPLGVELKRLGHKVGVVGPGESPEILKELGIDFYPVAISRKGKSFFEELKTIYQLYRLFKHTKPDVVHLVTIKPYLYGGIAARLAHVPAVVSAVAGLGILFSQSTFKSKLLRTLLYPFYRISFGHSNQKVIFQNSNDLDELVNWGVLSNEKAIIIRGAGVELKDYNFFDEPNDVPIVTFAARLLKDKGVIEFVEASKILKERGIKARFWLIGDVDQGNKNTVVQQELDDWEKEGLVECFGYRTDIPDLFSQSNIISLPSYYGEGLPKVLIEAAACGRAVVTTDWPGCRDAIIPYETGLLVPIKNSEALADAFEKLIKDNNLRQNLGKAGRKLAEETFVIEKVVAQHMDIYQGLLND